MLELCKKTGVHIGESSMFPSSEEVFKKNLLRNCSVVLYVVIFMSSRIFANLSYLKFERK